jgi:hypothetical protein
MTPRPTANSIDALRDFLFSPQGKATIMIAFLALTAGCMGALEDGDDSGSPGAEPLDTVPEGVDGVAFFSGQIVQDQATEELMNGFLERAKQVDPEYDGPQTWQEAVSEFESETDVRTTGFNSALMFFKQQNGNFDQEYAGVLVDTDWSSEELLETFDEEPRQETYNGVTVWIEEDPLTEQETWAADFGDGNYALGSSQAVQDAIDTSNGELNAFSGQLRESYQTADDGLMKMAVTIPQEQTQGLGFQVDVMTMTYFTEGSQMNMQAQFTMGSAADAENAAGTISLFLDQFQSQFEQDGRQELADIIDRLSIDAAGNQLQATFATSPEEVLSILDQSFLGQGGTQLSPQTAVAG